LAVRATAVGDSCPVAIYFGNGILSSEDDAVSAATLLGVEVNAELTKSGKASLPAECYRTAYAVSGLTKEDEPGFWDGVFDVLESFGQIVSDNMTLLVKTAFPEFVNVEYAINDDVQDQVSEYRSALTSSERIVIVSHSQGNLFANESYKALTTGEDGLPSIAGDRIKTVSVATPQSFVAGGGPHTTLYGDIILIVPTARFANTDVAGSQCDPFPFLGQLPGNHPVDCHDFVDSYMEGTHSRERILDGIVAAIGDLAAPLQISGGVFFSRGIGVTGTAFSYNPLVGSTPISRLMISGPPGWNGSAEYQCAPGVYKPPAISLDRALCWHFAAPAEGTYTATATWGGYKRSTSVTINPSDQLPPPRIFHLNFNVSQVVVEWEGAPGARSYLVRLNPTPYTGVITKEIVVAAAARKVTFSGLSLIPNTPYQLVVFAFSQDVQSPDPLVGSFNISADQFSFSIPTAPAAYQSLTTGDPRVPGDGVTVGPKPGLGSWYELTTPFNLGTATTGLTVTIFPTAGNDTGSLGFVLTAKSSTIPVCHFSLLTGWASNKGEATANGVSGTYWAIPQARLDELLTYIRGQAVGCNYKLSEISLTEFAVLLGNGSSQQRSVDAVAIGLGSSATP
jgi:hypothetical protein